MAWRSRVSGPIILAGGFLIQRALALRRTCLRSPDKSHIRSWSRPRAIQGLVSCGGKCGTPTASTATIAANDLVHMRELVSYFSILPLEGASDSLNDFVKVLSSENSDLPALDNHQDVGISSKLSGGRRRL